LKRKLFSIFPIRLDIYKFIELVENSNYPNIDKKELSKNIIQYDSNFVLLKKLNFNQVRKLKNILSNLSEEITDILNKNNLGSIENWELYVSYVEHENNKYFIGFGFECIKPFSKFKKGECFYEKKTRFFARLS
jgi:hypothetical protein